MRTRQPRGFTLIEQVAVIALVGTVSATALPSLVAVKADADQALLATLAASAGTALLLNQAGCLVTGQRSVPGKCQPVQDCADVAGLLATALPEGYRVQRQPLSPQGSACSMRRTVDGRSAGFHGAAAGS